MTIILYSYFLFLFATTRKVKEVPRWGVVSLTSPQGQRIKAMDSASQRVCYDQSFLSIAIKAQEKIMFVKALVS